MYLFVKYLFYERYCADIEFVFSFFFFHFSFFLFYFFHFSFLTLPLPPSPSLSLSLSPSLSPPPPPPLSPSTSNYAHVWNNPNMVNLGKEVVLVLVLGICFVSITDNFQSLATTLTVFFLYVLTVFFFMFGYGVFFFFIFFFLFQICIFNFLNSFSLHIYKNIILSYFTHPLPLPPSPSSPPLT